MFARKFRILFLLFAFEFNLVYLQMSTNKDCFMKKGKNYWKLVKQSEFVHNSELNDWMVENEIAKSSGNVYLWLCVTFI